MKKRPKKSAINRREFLSMAGILLGATQAQAFFNTLMLRKRKPLQLIGSVVSTTATVSLPAGSAVGDAFISMFYVANINTVTPPTLTLPAGFTSIISQANYSTAQADADRYAFAYKILTAGDISAGSFSYSGSAGTGYWAARGITIRKSGGAVTGITLKSSSSVGSQGSVLTSPLSQSLSITGASAPCVVFCCASRGTATSSTLSVSPSNGVAFISSATDSHTVAYKILNTLDGNQTCSFTWTGTGNIQYFTSTLLQIT